MLLLFWADGSETRTESIYLVKSRSRSTHLRLAQGKLFDSLLAQDDNFCSRASKVCWASSTLRCCFEVEASGKAVWGESIKRKPGRFAFDQQPQN